MLEARPVTDRILDRLNLVLPRLESEQLRENLGLGNEIGFYIFDYDPKHELLVRSHIDLISDTVAKKANGIRISEVNLFGLLVQMLKDRGLWDRVVQAQRAIGDEATLKGLRGPLQEDKVAEALVEAACPEAHDVVLLTGVGNAFPLLRSHTLLNNLQSKMGNTPLVVFYPGVYDGKGLRLFDLLDSGNYYRAFRLVP